MIFSVNKIITLSLLFFCYHTAVSQSLNRLNKEGERTGRWITYIDESKKLKSFDGKFKNGKSVGKSYYYNNYGILDRTEINRFKKLKTSFYHSNGVLRLKGKAKLKNEPDRIHYYFYGKWKAYDETGKLVKYYFYENGKLLKTVYVDKNNKTNDSLIEALNLIDKEFAAHNSILTDSINKNAKNTFKSLVFKEELRIQDSLSFIQIEKILRIYGYPSQAIAGESAVIPFYIIGYAPCTVKEKYLDLFKKAADKGDISWKALAFYIDKIKIEKKEKQIYGTQYYTVYSKEDKNYHYIYYPSEDEVHLKERRKSVGLDD